MNDDELGVHLRSTLEPVSSPTPELARLRRIARRRRQRRQLTAGGLGLLLIVGTGFGIAEATNSGSGRATVTAGRSPATALPDVTVPCQTAQISIQLGQTLRVTPCSDLDGHTVGAVPSSGTALSQVSRGTFHGDEPGVSTLEIQYTGCAGPSGTGCAADQRFIGTVTVIVGASSPPNVSDVVTVPCQHASVNLTVGQVLEVLGCSPGRQLISGSGSPGVAVQQTGPAAFRAVAGGAAKIAISQPCASGRGCFDAPDFAVISVSVTSGGTSTTGPPTFVNEVEPPCRGGRVSVPVGDWLFLTACPPGLSSHIDDPSVLAPGTTADRFTAQKAGTTNVELFVKPQCSPGMLCPQYIRDLGTLVVTVTPAG